MHTSKRARTFNFTKLAIAAIECKLAMVTSRLVEFELLLQLKFEQKKGTSLVKLVLSRRKSMVTTERLSVPVIYFDIRG
jgi:hypothetical protein